ncbi:MAG: SsrA-binding protein SmpB [Planctomycetes bacterium]|nr:SsrA-binding protein SmpB [Planctomycetota bacterium]
MASKKNKSDGASTPGNPTIRNRKARFNFHIEDTLEAGIVLLGSEVKSLRDGKANLDEAYARLQNDEVYLHNMHIGPYDQAGPTQHDPRRTRKLLVHRREIRRVLVRALINGYTLVPLDVHWSRGNAKIELALARGKREFDKREDIKRRDTERDTRREMGRHKGRR